MFKKHSFRDFTPIFLAQFHRLFAILLLSMMIYGLTGGIACGKTTLGEMMRQAGWAIVDSDAIAHQLMEPDQINWKNVVDGFGEKILNSDRTINRRALGDLVFSQPSLRQKLNALTHPAIRNAWQAERNRFAASHASQPMVVIIPLLFECGYEKEFDSTLCVACSPARQRQRLLARGFDDAQVKQRLDSQMALSEKMNSSHRVIWNEGSLDCLHRQFEQLPSA